LNMHTDKVNVKTKLCYSIGAISDVLMANIIFQLSGPIYVQALHVNPVMIGLAVSIPRLWDAFVDPFIGNLSDNSRYKWGRRRPFMFFGSLFACIFCILMWIPPLSLGQTGLFLYFLIISIFFFTTYAVYSIPFNALGYEMTSDYDQRTSVMSYKTFMMNVGSVLLLPWAFKLCRLDIFGSNEVIGVRYVGALFALSIFIAAIIPSFFAREISDAQTQPRMRLLPAFKYTFGNKPFLFINAIVILTLSGVFLAFPLLFYINMAYICPANKDATATMTGWYGTVYGISGIVFIPLINYLGQKLGKKKALIFGLSVIIIGFFASWWLFTPKNPYLQLIFAVLMSPSLSCVFILTSSMIADVCDLDELKTNLRREGMYGAVFGFLVKLALAAVLAMSGLILNGTGYNTNVEIQGQDTIRNLRLFFVWLPISLLCISLVLTAMFPLSREKMLEIRRQLNQRREIIPEKI
jgi:GPH family glycoside/pentoside/hexuronide:cation symporter